MFHVDKHSAVFCGMFCQQPWLLYSCLFLDWSANKTLHVFLGGEHGGGGGGGGGGIEGGGMSCDTASLLTCLASSISESESEVWCLQKWSCASLLSKRSEYLSMRQPVTDPSFATVLNLFSTYKTVHPNYTFRLLSKVKTFPLRFIHCKKGFIFHWTLSDRTRMKQSTSVMHVNRCSCY